MNYPEIQQKTFLALLIAFSLAFIGILLPFYGAVFWAAVPVSYTHLTLPTKA